MDLKFGVVACPPVGQSSRRLSHQHIDVVLYDYDTTRIVAAIELNDVSHDQLDRRT
jgi:hypothetical protein